MKFSKWHIAPAEEADIRRLGEAGYPQLVSQVLAARGISTAEEAAAFLERGRDLTCSPFLMKDMDRAVECISRAIGQGLRMAVFGDYDVDGITATVILVDYLKSRGVDVLHYIPRRIEDGYGLGQDAIRSLHEQGVELLITVDCGITGVEEVDFAASLGMDVVITDHHECKDTLPRAVAVVDPHRPDCTYPFPYLAGCGVALKLVLALGGESREEALFSRYCTLAAIGTIADVMRMEGENRTIVSCGLAALNHTDFVGIHALLKEAGLLGKPITSIQIGFVLSPRINAAGRMGAADLAADLLQETDPVKAEELAKQLCDLNRERQAVEQSICADAIAQIERLRPEERNALVLSSEEWHQGVVGIVASRLSEKYAAPSFMIHLKDGSGKGSCRSWGGINLFELLEECAPLLESFGGHALAAGFTVREERIPALAQALAQAVAERAQGTELPSVLEADGVVPPELLTVEEVSALDRLEPCGVGNPRPVLVLSGVQIHSMAQVGRGRHLKLKLESRGILLDAIWFSADGGELGLSPGCRVDAAFYPQINEFRGCRSVQLQIIDLRPAPSRAQLEQAIYDKYRRDEALTPQEARFLLPSREEFVCLWKWLDRHCSPSGPLEDTLPRISRAVARSGRQVEVPARTLLCLEVLEERGLIQLGRSAGRLQITLNRLEGKVDLDASLLLRRLRDVLRE